MIRAVNDSRVFIQSPERSKKRSCFLFFRNKVRWWVSYQMDPQTSNRAFLGRQGGVCLVVFRGLKGIPPSSRTAVNFLSLIHISMRTVSGVSRFVPVGDDVC